MALAVFGDAVKGISSCLEWFLRPVVRDAGRRKSAASIGASVISVTAAAGAARSILGKRATSFTAAVGVGVLGLSCKDVLRNYACGVAMSWSKTLKVGDVVTVGTLPGAVRATVASVGLQRVEFVSSATDPAGGPGSRVTLPNSSVYLSPIVRHDA